MLQDISIGSKLLYVKIRKTDRTGYAHIAFSVGNKERVDELTERLRSDGFEAVNGPRTTGDGYFCV